MKLLKSLFVLAIVITACVPARKYEELNADYRKTYSENEELLAKVENLSSENKELKSKVNQLTEDIEVMTVDSAQKGRMMRRLEKQYEKIDQLNNELLDKYTKLQKGSEVETSRILRELDGVKEELQKREDELNQLERELAERRNEMEKLSKELEVREKRVVELEELLAEKDEKVREIQSTISKALLAYQDKGLSVEMKFGKVYVSMEAKLLFAVGGTKVGEEGVEALIDVAKALESQEDIEIYVEGHTDSDDFDSPNSPKNNWELSVLRATSVVQLLLANSDLDPKSVIASGRSSYLPVDSMDKAKNRRIEIILSPRLDKLFEVIGQGNLDKE